MAILAVLGQFKGPSIGKKQKLAYGSPSSVSQWDLSNIAIKTAIHEHSVDIVHYKSLLHHEEHLFLA